MGKAYLNEGRISDAEQVYRAGWERFSRYPPFNFNLGNISEMKGDTVQAMEYYHQVLVNAPGFAPAAERLARIFEGQGQLDSALHYFERVARYARPNPRLDRKIEDLRQQIGTGE